MLDLLSAWLEGFGLGGLGLAPFMHTNLVLEMFPPGAGWIGAVFAASLAFSHAAFEAIPAVFFGIPTADMAVSALPAHRMALDGKAMLALGIITSSLVLGVLAAILLLPFALAFIPLAYQSVRPVTAPLLTLVVLGMFVGERSIKGAIGGALVFVLSGTLGVLALQTPVVDGDALFALLSGLFGFPALLASWGSENASVDTGLKTVARIPLRFVLAGAIGGALSGLVPAVSAVMVSALLFIFLEGSTREFLTLNSALAGSRLVFDTLATQTIGKARTGGAYAVLTALGPNDPLGLSIAIGMGVAALIGAALITGLIARQAGRWLSRPAVNKRLVTMVFAITLLSIAVRGGPAGLLVAATGAAVGSLPLLLGVKRSNAMGALVLPAILYGFMGPWAVETLLLG